MHRARVSKFLFIGNDGAGPGSCSQQKMYEQKIKSLITLSGRMRCEYCDKDAIGYPGFGCCSAYVCANHADRFVLDLRPGERTISGECVFERFGEPK